MCICVPVVICTRGVGLRAYTLPPGLCSHSAMQVITRYNGSKDTVAISFACHQGDGYGDLFLYLFPGIMKTQEKSPCALRYKSIFT